MSRRPVTSPVPAAWAECTTVLQGVDRMVPNRPALRSVTVSAVLVVGGGGHALVAIEVLRAAGHRIIGVLTADGRPTDGLDRLNVQVVGTDERLAERVSAGDRDFFVAIGANQTRRRLAEDVLGAGGLLVGAVSPSSFVSVTVDVGAGALVMPGAVVNVLTVIGPGAIVNTRASVDHECSIGAYAHVGPGVAVAGGVTIGEGALIGIGACIVPGRAIGEWAIVGAGAAVTRDVPPGATVAGVPARVIGPC